MKKMTYNDMINNIDEIDHIIDDLNDDLNARFVKPRNYSKIKAIFHKMKMNNEFKLRDFSDLTRYLRYEKIFQ